MDDLGVPLFLETPKYLEHGFLTFLAWIELNLFPPFSFFKRISTVIFSAQKIEISQAPNLPKLGVPHLILGRKPSTRKTNKGCRLQIWFIGIFISWPIIIPKKTWVGFHPLYFTQTNQCFFFIAQLVLRLFQHTDQGLFTIGFPYFWGACVLG